MVDACDLVKVAADRADHSLEEAVTTKTIATRGLADGEIPLTLAGGYGDDRTRDVSITSVYLRCSFGVVGWSSTFRQEEGPTVSGQDHFPDLSSSTTAACPFSAAYDSDVRPFSYVN